MPKISLLGQKLWPICKSQSGGESEEGGPISSLSLQRETVSHHERSDIIFSAQRHKKQNIVNQSALNSSLFSTP